MAFFEKSYGYESKTSYPENLGALQCRGRECRGRVPMVVSGGVMTAWDRHWAGGVLCGDAVWLPRGINAPTHGLPFHITSHHHITSHPITSHHIIWFCCVMLLDIRRLSDRYATAIRWLSDGSYNGFPTDSRRKLGSYPTAIRWLSTPDQATIFLKQLDLDGFLNNLGI